MATYVYKKQKPQYAPLLVSNQSITQREKDPIWTFLMKKKKEQLLISGVLTIAGAVLLMSQVIPMIYSRIEEYYVEQGAVTVSSPVPTTYAAEREQLAFYNVNESYFRNLVGSVSGRTLRGPGGDLEPLRIDQEYKNPMLMTIPTVGIQNLTISPNVDSYNETVYNEALKIGAAHFKGTVLPGDNEHGNVVIYGHSALPGFFEQNPDYKETEFTKILKVRVGDRFTITRDGEVFEYIVVKNQIVDPDDFDSLSGIPGESTVTLITCFPAGDPSGRWITIAKEVN